MCASKKNYKTWNSTKCAATLVLPEQINAVFLESAT